jgi:hypothetical protein
MLAIFNVLFVGDKKGDIRPKMLIEQLTINGNIFDFLKMERETGFEPATPTLARSCSTN